MSDVASPDGGSGPTLRGFAWAIATGYLALHLASAALRWSHGRASLGWLLVLAAATTSLVVLHLRRSHRPDVESGLAPAPPRASRGSRVAGWLVLTAFAVIATLHLDRVPGLRGDETLYLQYPANYARYDRFETRLGEELGPDLLTATATGPTLLVPAALLLHRFGVSLAGARAVSAVGLLVCGVGLALLAARIGGTLAGVVALVALIGCAETTNTGRMFMGDFPALGLLLFGCLTWLDSLEIELRRPHLRLVAASVALGLMVLTKNTFALSAFGFLAFALHDRGAARSVRLRHLLLPVVFVLALNAPWEAYRHHRGTRSTLEYAASELGLDYTTPRLTGSLSKAREMVARPETLLAAAGLVYLLARGGRARRQGVLLGAIACVWSAWFLTFAVTLHRYIIAPSVVWIVVAAPLVADMLRSLSRRLPARELAAALAIVTAGLVLPGLRAGSALAAVITAPRRVMDEQRVVDGLAGMLDPGAFVNANLVLHGVCFFGDRPIHVVSPADAASLPVDAIYVWMRPAEESRAALPGFTKELEAGPYLVLRRSLVDE